MAAIGAGIPPDNYSQTPAAKDGLERIRRCLRDNPPANMHNRAMKMLASLVVDGIMTARFELNLSCRWPSISFHFIPNLALCEFPLFLFLLFGCWTVSREHGAVIRLLHFVLFAGQLLQLLQLTGLQHVFDHLLLQLFAQLLNPLL